jgi:O-antigen ligase
VIVAATVYVLSPLGAISIFGRRVSDYQLIDLTVGGHGTGIHFGKSAGLFLAPLEPSVLMVVALLALLGWTSMRSGRWLWAGRAAIVFLVPAILITLDRSAWLTAIIATGVFAVLPAARRSAAVTAGILCLVFALSFFSVLANVVGANAVSANPIATECATGCTQAAPGSDEAPLRGGTGLSGREFLWTASFLAINHRPITGYGPGTNVPAIDTYLTGDGLHFKGLTSHDTWLRTAVELGIPGLLFLLAVLLSATLVFLRAPLDPRQPSERRTGIPDPTRVTFAVSLLGLLGAMTFESFFLGGVNFSNLYLGLALAMMVPPMTLDHFLGTLSRRTPRPKPK